MTKLRSVGQLEQWLNHLRHRLEDLGLWKFVQETLTRLKRSTQSRVDWDLAKKRNSFLLSESLAASGREDVGFLGAVRAHVPAHVLYHSKDGDFCLATKRCLATDVVQGDPLEDARLECGGDGCECVVNMSECVRSTQIVRCACARDVDARQ